MLEGGSRSIPITRAYEQIEIAERPLGGVGVRAMRDRGTLQHDELDLLIVEALRDGQEPPLDRERPHHRVAERPVEERALPVRQHEDAGIRSRHRDPVKLVAGQVLEEGSADLVQPDRVAPGVRRQRCPGQARDEAAGVVVIHDAPPLRAPRL